MTKESTQYESLVKELYEALLKQDAFANINVLHNVTIIGKSGAKHQIDVYWEFQLAGVKYKTCIECKHYNSKIKKSHIASFSAILDDIGNANGIFATTIDYQIGAKLFAKEKGIRLVLVNYLFKTMNIKGTFIIPHLQIKNLEFDKGFTKSVLASKNLKSYNFSLNIGGETIIYNEEGKNPISLQLYLKKYFSIEGNQTIPMDNYFLLTDIGYLKIDNISIFVTHNKIDSEQTITINDTSNAIIEDILENNSFYLNDDGSVTKIKN